MKHVPHKKPEFDNEFVARYRVLDAVCGTFKGEVISFTAYDHYGWPAFSKYRNVLLYVTKYRGKYYHEKYLYSPVFKTRDGRWAAPFMAQWHDGDSSEWTVRPVPIEFADSVYFDMSCHKKMERLRAFPQPYYEWQGHLAIARLGNYAPDLFASMRDGILQSRGFFGAAHSELDSVAYPPIEEVEFAPFPEPLPAADSTLLLETWHRLTRALNENNGDAVRAMSLDSVICSVCEGPPAPYYENNVEPIDSLVGAAQHWFSAFGLWDAFRQSPLCNRNDEMIEVASTSGASYYFRDWEPTGPFYSLRFQTQHVIAGYTQYPIHSFRFIKQDGRFLFAGMYSK